MAPYRQEIDPGDTLSLNKHAKIPEVIAILDLATPHLVRREIAERFYEAIKMRPHGLELEYYAYIVRACINAVLKGDVTLRSGDIGPEDHWKIPSAFPIETIRYLLQVTRTAAFVEAASQSRGKIIDAGTGATGILAFIAALASTENSVTALEVGKTNFLCARQVMKLFGLTDSVSVCWADATKFVPQEAVDGIITETFRNGLLGEPGIQIAAHLNRFLVQGGSIFPSAVAMDMMLVGQSDRHQERNNAQVLDLQDDLSRENVDVDLKLQASAETPRFDRTSIYTRARLIDPKRRPEEQTLFWDNGITEWTKVGQCNVNPGDWVHVSYPSGGGANDIKITTPSSVFSNSRMGLKQSREREG